LDEADILFIFQNSGNTTMHDHVKDYYGKTLQHSDDLKTNACCTTTALPQYVKMALSNIHDEVLSRYYGCGLIAPALLKNMRVLDLGCGSGRDCYVISQWVGEEGFVVGVDMTEEQIEVARKHQDYHANAFGYAKPNTEFLTGYIEKLDELNLPEQSFDIIVSNCVINLSPDKEAVLKGVFKLLKPGGEFYFSDVYSDRRVPDNLIQDPVLYGECLSGALYWADFQDLAKKCGFFDPRLVEDEMIMIENDEVQDTIGHINFYSATYRLFKLTDLESQCEDYGQAVIYKGSIPNHEKAYLFDKHHYIDAGKVFLVCGNTWRMLKDSRFSEHFEFIGNFNNHYGIFEGCGTSIPFDNLMAEHHDHDHDSHSCC
jgi:SAM-dependent methyltransferase